MLLSSADLFKINFSEKFFQECIKSIKQFYPDQARRYVGPDFVSNCSQRLSADVTRRQRVNIVRAQKFGYVSQYPGARRNINM